MSHHHEPHPERRRKAQESQRAAARSALFAASGTGVIFAVLIGLILRNWTFGIIMGVIAALAVYFALNAIRRDSHKLAKHGETKSAKRTRKSEHKR